MSPLSKSQRNEIGIVLRNADFIKGFSPVSERNRSNNALLFPKKNQKGVVLLRRILVTQSLVKQRELVLASKND